MSQQGLEQTPHRVFADLFVERCSVRGESYGLVEARQKTPHQFARFSNVLGCGFTGPGFRRMGGTLAFSTLRFLQDEVLPPHEVPQFLVDAVGRYVRAHAQLPEFDALQNAARFRVSAFAGEEGRQRAHAAPVMQPRPARVERTSLASRPG